MQSWNKIFIYPIKLVPQLETFISWGWRKTYSSAILIWLLGRKFLFMKWFAHLPL